MNEDIHYFSDLGGMPEPNTFKSDRAIFKEAYIFIPRGCIRDIVASFFPGWTNTRSWVLAKPLTGFTETFSYYFISFPTFLAAKTSNQRKNGTRKNREII